MTAAMSVETSGFGVPRLFVTEMTGARLGNRPRWDNRSPPDSGSRTFVTALPGTRPGDQWEVRDQINRTRPNNPKSDTNLLIK